MYKRKAEYTFETPSKKSRTGELWDPIQKLKLKSKNIGSLKINNYISGTSIKNYLLRDPVLDWCDLYYFSSQTRSQQKKLEKKIQFFLITDFY